MNKKYFLTLALIAMAAVARGQATTPATPSQGDPSITENGVIGEVKAIDAAAKQMIVMTEADIAKKQDAERAEWRRRGILGVITGLKPESKEITISSRSMAGTQAVVIPVTE